MFIPVGALGPCRGAGLIREEREPAAKFPREAQEAEFGGLRGVSEEEKEGDVWVLPFPSGIPGREAKRGN